MIQRVELTTGQLIIVSAHAKRANIGGRSHVDAARSRQSEYQMTGMACEAAAWKALHPKGFLGWDLTRCRKNTAPLVGDGGVDLLGDVDVKGSLMRSQRDPLDYRLWVRPQEYSERNRYLLALSKKGYKQILLVGWCYGSDLKKDQEGRYGRSGRELKDVSQL